MSEEKKEEEVKKEEIKEEINPLSEKEEKKDVFPDVPEISFPEDIDTSPIKVEEKKEVVKEKKRRGRPRKDAINDKKDNTDNQIDFSVVFPMLINSSIFLLSRTKYFKNEPLSKDEEKLLADSFKKAFPQVDASPKVMLLIIVFFTLFSRINIKS